MQLRLSLLLGFICFVLVGSGQPGFLSYTIKNGLSQNAVTAIFRDSKGYVWLGTQDGLNRFDGIGFTKFKHDTNDTLTISDQYITAISEDGLGNIWVGTRNGLNKFSYHSNRFERIHINPNRRNIIQYVFEQIFPLGNGDLAFVAEDQLYVWLHQKKLIKKLMGKYSDRSAYTVNEQGIWRLNKSKLFQYDLQTFALKRIHPFSGILDTSASISRIVFDHAQKLWLVNERVEHKPQVKIVKINSRISVLSSFQLPEKIYHLSFDLSNQAWFSSLSGLLIVDSTYRTYYWRGAQLPSILNQANAVLCSYHDATGISWVGFANNGVLVYNHTASAFNLIQPLNKTETVFGFAVDSNNNEWLAAVSGIYKKAQTDKSWKLVSKKK
ncbi:two-component regulator propeller domain-containing protein [Sediminibacterium sp. C3]|uniref:ligand-binding sensor domain-containing protein n=1 Tax=Sediminibacterium sp. C3 TaxID=1267211 RepID=UPI00041D95CE|nr:two-component regulator propeller domain-containing protein [Sediminibacterium sp. C3]